MSLAKEKKPEPRCALIPCRDFIYSDERAETSVPQPTRRQHTSNTPATHRQHAGKTPATRRQHAGNMPATCPAGVQLGSSWGPAGVQLGSARLTSPTQLRFPASLKLIGECLSLPPPW
eukprot:gene19568-biopygen14572